MPGSATKLSPQLTHRNCAHRADYVPGTTLSVSAVSVYTMPVHGSPVRLVPSAPHFTGEEAEAQTGENMGVWSLSRGSQASCARSV